MQASVATLPRKFRPPTPELGLDTFKKVDAVVVDAVELVKAIHGAGNVELRGFSEARAMPIWTHPAVAHVVVADSARDALSTLVADQRRMRMVFAFAAVLLVVSAFCAGALFAYLKGSHVAAAVPTLVWTAVDMSEKGLVVATPAGRVVVPLGGKLPNGDVVLAVQPARRVVVLSSGTLVLPQERRSKP